jgi:deoxyribonuclease V
MKPIRFHSWNVSPNEASAIQLNLRDKVVIQPLPEEIHLVAGTSVVHDPNTNTIHAALVVLRFPDMELVERHGLSEEITFPYVRGILAFREAPPIMKLMKRIQHIPDVVLFHSHGLAHPRRFGLASHLGVLFDVPSIGIADRVLIGFHDDIDPEKGHHAPLMHEGEEVGFALRTKDDVQPVFISVGHKADLLTTMEFILECSTHYRQPEPIRQAHLSAVSQRDGEKIDIDIGGDQSTLF